METARDSIPEKLLHRKCLELIKLCNASGMGYGVFFIESPGIVCGGADLSLGEIISLLGKISSGLNRNDISLFIESLRQAASGKPLR